MAEIDWLKIKNEYIHTLTSFRKLAEKYKVNKDTIALRAKAEDWKALRVRQTDKIQAQTIQKTAEKIADRESDRMARISTLTDRLIDKLELAIEQADQYNIRQTKRIVMTSYNESRQPIMQVSTEKADLKQTAGIIDKAGLKRISAALKDARDIQSVETDDNQIKKLDEILEKMGEKV